jgi:hypothetical protein
MDRKDGAVQSGNDRKEKKQTYSHAS